MKVSDEKIKEDYSKEEEDDVVISSENSGFVRERNSISKKKFI